MKEQVNLLSVVRGAWSMEGGESIKIIIIRIFSLVFELINFG